VVVVERPQEAVLHHMPTFDFFFHTLKPHRKKKTVVTIHDAIPLEFPRAYQPGIKGSLRLLKQRLALRAVHAVITDSHASKKSIHQRLGVALSRIFVVPLAANPALKNVSETQQKSHLVHVRDVRDQKIPTYYILYVGDINYNKNIPQLIKSLKNLDTRIHLVCVGVHFTPQPIPEWRSISQQITLSEVSDRVHFVTSVVGEGANDTLSALYSGAIAYVQPSLSEGFGLPVLEAMQCRVPVVSTHVASLVEVGGHHVEYARDTSAVELAAAVKRVLKWSVVKRAHRVRAAARWAAQFTWERTAELTVGVYQDVLAKQS
jgi:glycosyltransferase involved in cell wall biosynthesis